MNIQRFNQVLAMIEANPAHWNQQFWHCNSSHCFAGFAELECLKLQPRHTICDVVAARVEAANTAAKTWQVAIDYLELTEEQADWLFLPYRTLDDFRWVRRMHGRWGADQPE